MQSATAAIAAPETSEVASTDARPGTKRGRSPGQTSCVSRAEVTAARETKPVVYGIVTSLLAHGGTGGLIVELVPIVAIVGLGIAVWWRSRRAPESSASGDEAPVQE